MIYLVFNKLSDSSYKGAPKYLGESVTGSEIGKHEIDMMTVCVWLLEMAGLGHQQMHRWVGMTPTAACTRFFPPEEEKQTIVTSLDDVTVMVLTYRVGVKQGECALSLRGSHLCFWLQYIWLHFVRKPPDPLSCSYLSASWGVEL